MSVCLMLGVRGNLAIEIKFMSSGIVVIGVVTMRRDNGKYLWYKE